ncbi:MAG: ABC transporter ATP-binding protein [Candidatus Poribacteria bacterium]|jgi:ATP-binding cassette subfamily B protein|nr:ABC transporter ATP-binding protein [Candidatus Poribacteria bacterium]
MLFVCTVMLFLTNVAILASPELLKLVINNLEQNLATITRREITYYATGLLGLALVAGVFRFGYRRLIGGLAVRIEYDLRNNLFQHLQKMSKSYFDDESTGDLMSRATNDLESVRRLIGFAIVFIVDSTVFFFMALVIMLRIDVKLTLLALLPYPLLAIVVQQMTGRLHDMYEAIQEGFADMNTKVQENLLGARIVKAYNLEQRELQDFDQRSQHFVDLNRVFYRIEAILFPLFRLLPGIGTIILLWVGGIHVVEAKITIGDFVAFTAYLAMLTRPMIMLGFIINRFAQGSASMDRIYAILDTPPLITDGPNVRHDISRIRGEVEFRNLTFSYPNLPPILKNINLKIPAGSTVAIIGSTGSGKSTLANLIPRIFNVEVGSLFIDGIDISQLPLKMLRSQIGVVQQEAFLFSDLLKNNIAFGVDVASETEIKTSAYSVDLLAQIDEFPDQLETFVGEKGKTLSGGQRQRTAIARAILTQPKILILDDAFASVDTHTEDTILQRLAQVVSNSTTIIISHRVSTVKSADLIVILEDGEIVERGTHLELLAQDSHYAKIHQRQLLVEEIETMETI